MSRTALTTHGEGGTSSVEFALIATVLFTLIFGVIEFGRAIWLQQAVSAASREGSRFGVATGKNGSLPQYIDCDGIKAAAAAKVPDIGLTAADVTVRYELYPPSPGPSSTPTATPSCNASSPPPLKSGDKVVVEVSKPMDINLPLVPLGAFTATAVDERSLYLGSTP